MGLLSWVGSIFTLRDGQFWGKWYGGETWAGRPVNEQNALNLSTWWRCVRLYADIVGAMSLKFYERVGDNDRKENRDHQIAQLIRTNPNIDQTPQEFWSGMAASLAMVGNAFAEKQYVGSKIVALDPLPCDVAVERDTNNVLTYAYYDRGKKEVLPRDKVFQIRGFTLGKADVGISPLAAARQGLSVALATEEAAGKTFSQGLRTSGFFSGPRLTPDQRRQFTETFIEPIVGNDAKAHYGILENGFSFQPVVIPPKDAEMLLSRRFNVEELCRFMGVPPILAGHVAEGQTAWGTGIEAIISEWLASGLNAFLCYVEGSINKRLLSPEDRQNYFAEFDRNSLLRTDSQSRSELYWKLAQLGAITPNQICSRENFPQFDGGDVRLLNATLIPLADAGRLSSRLPKPDEVVPHPAGTPKPAPAPAKPAG